MKVIWKRPDGFHNASPSDYKVVQLTSGASLWLHKSNTEWYPFRVSGDWAKEEGTIKLNGLINLLEANSERWAEHLSSLFFDSKVDEPKTFINEQLKWLDKIKDHLKGDTWELDLMEQVVSEIYSKVKECSDLFLKSASK
jgi:hypothetical protein